MVTISNDVGCADEVRTTLIDRVKLENDIEDTATPRISVAVIAGADHGAHPREVIRQTPRRPAVPADR
ncbi:hypothetical protein [Arthrobacter oryzae]|uniref:hypothetical protein n=1 Tax=Arthrobacter oryzae TaxID=409290 RepID=UPI00285D8811|nr:hypothetical protein [Arthrobacter oryzae]MDR6508083.1 hypothetical protein [Arthrobacter oryzae]